jgi:DNA-binding NarL/FixJ family response regulator
MLRILVADDHALFRRGVMQLLADEYRDATFGEAETSDEALAKARAEQWDIVILDIAMPGRSGLEALIEIRRLEPAPRVLVLSVHPEEQYAKTVLRMGGDGYLMKSSAPTDLVRAVKIVSKGNKYVSSSLAEMLASELVSKRSKAPHELLSKREFQILCRLAAGRPATVIAQELKLSAKTVSTFRARILKKLNLKSNSDITRYALQHSLIE